MGCSPTAASATPKSVDPPRVVAVAYSGGRDSTALLHATLAATQGTDIRVVALHVHHNLNAAADAWAERCLEQCAVWRAGGWPVELVVHRVDHRPTRGESIEAWAREARYQALHMMALSRGAEVVLLAHHRRDQAETWLLQALRGAGLAGLASMPGSARRAGVTWLRPWLNRTRDEIDAYVRQHALTHVEDNSNHDPRFMRNRLRLHLWPALTAAFPHAEASLAASAAWAAEAADALAELARIDLETCSSGETLHITVWLALTPARRSNSLRCWLKDRSGVAASANTVLRLLAELPSCASGSRWQMPDGELRCHRRQLRYLPTSLQAPRPAREPSISVHRAGVRVLPGWGGRLSFTRVFDGGVPLAWLGHLELRERSGAEHFQAGPGRPPRSLKKQFQAADVPVWDRHGPLVYSGDQLVYVPGLGIDARALGLPGQPSMTLHWQPDDTG